MRFLFVLFCGCVHAACSMQHNVMMSCIDCITVRGYSQKSEVIVGVGIEVIVGSRNRS
jgi:hypothetical protein